MKFCKKISALCAAVLMLTLIVPAALAVSDTSVEAGKTATLTFTFADVFNVDGAFAVSDPQGIVTAHKVTVANAGATMATVSGDRLWASPGVEPVKTTVSVAVDVTISANAQAGATCTVSFSGIYGDGNEEPGNEHDVYQSAVITVKEKDVVVTPAPTPTPVVTPTPGPTQTPAPTPTPGVSAEPKPSVVIDYSELEKQIGVANGLNLTEYTNETREELANALSAGKSALKSKNQTEVTNAAKALENAIANLVKMDYSRLNAAMAEAAAYAESQELSGLWQQMSEMVVAGNELLSSGDQASVDAAAAGIEELLSQIKAEIEDMQTVGTVVKEVPVEVLPEDDFCNIPMHHVWPILFGASLALNVALGAVIVAYAIKKKKNRKDDTPLVDYDIDDDI